MKTARQVVHQTKHELLTEWDKARREVAQAKTHELELRQRIIDQIPEIPEGTSKHIFGSEIITTIGRVNRRLSGDIPPSLNKYVTYKPSLNLAAYKKCTEMEKKRFEQCLTVKGGTPSIVW